MTVIDRIKMEVDGLNTNSYNLSVSCPRCGKQAILFCEEGYPNNSKEYGDMLEHIKNDKNCLREHNLENILNEDK